MTTTDPGLIAAAGGCLRVLALTGIRSEYDLLQPLLAALDADPAFDVGVIASGAHPTPLHDHSVRLIEADGFRLVATIANLAQADTGAGRSVTSGVLLTQLAQVLDREQPDLLLVLGDREEPLIGALAGTYQRIPVVHLAGGDHTHPAGGDIDEEIRHAATKLAHVHLTMAEAHSQRVIALGEEPWRVHTVGSGGLDKLRLEAGTDLVGLAACLGEDVHRPYVVVIHHPLHAIATEAAGELKLILDRILAAGLVAFVGAPNSDAGSHAIRDLTERRAAAHDDVHAYRHLPRPDFVGLLRHAVGLVGNSSLGLHEASYLGLPVINVGERQRGRLAGPGVCWIDADAGALDAALDTIRHDPSFLASLTPGSSPYGDGHMAERSLAALRALPDAATLLAKRLTY